jgi:4-amino-4-deoxy-L-arabinose transferase-like glycosyltransferase
VLASTIFSHLSVNNDETVYLLQAKAMAHGNLFPKVGHPASSFTPWLGVIHGDHYVLKYTPVVAAYLALSIAITGGYVAGLVVLAIGIVGATYLLAKEVTGHRGTAATAAVLLAASPLVIVQSALVLPYLLFLLLAELAIWALLAGSRRGGTWLLVVGGLCGGIAFVARSYDAVLMLTPVAAWVLWRARGGRLKLIGAVATGAIAPAIGLLWFDYAATGSPFRLPFSLFQSGDTLGFGLHRVYPGERGREFGLSQGWHGLARHLSLLGGGWLFGGVLLLVPVAVALKRRLASAACLAMLAGGAVLTLGYLFFWGTWNAGIIWGGVRYLGPYYLLPVLLPLCILAASGLREILLSSRWKPALVIALAVLISAITLGRALDTDAALNADNSALARTIAHQGNALVFVKTYPDYLQHPTSVISNRYPIGGRTVYSLTRGAADFQVLSSYPGRAVYQLRLLGEYGKHPGAGFGARLQRLGLFSGPTLGLDLTAALPKSVATARLEVTVDGRHQSWTLSGHHPDRVRVQLTAGAGGFPHVSPGGSGSVHVALMESGGRGGRQLDQLDIPLQSERGMLRALAPVALVAELGPLPRPPLAARISPAG